MERVQPLGGLVCICAECKKVIRTVLPAIESTTAQPIISHGICPQCVEALYGEKLRGLPLSPSVTVRRGAAAG
jgi:hypothetical protein